MLAKIVDFFWFSFFDGKAVFAAFSCWQAEDEDRDPQTRPGEETAVSPDDFPRKRRKMPQEPRILRQPGPPSQEEMQQQAKTKCFGVINTKVKLPSTSCAKPEALWASCAKNTAKSSV